MQITVCPALPFQAQIMFFKSDIQTTVQYSLFIRPQPYATRQSISASTTKSQDTLA